VNDWQSFKTPDRTELRAVAFLQSGNCFAATGELLLGWKTPKFEYVNGYKVVEVDGPIFRVYDNESQVGDDFPYSGEAIAYAMSLPTRDRLRR